MHNPEVQRADEDLRAAVAALAAFQRAVAERDGLARVVAHEAMRVAQLEAQLRSEQADVARLTSGVLGFLYSLAGDERLSIEQREVVEAQARLGEGYASRDRLASQLVQLDTWIAQQSESLLAARVRASREAKATALLRSQDPAADRLQDLDVRMEAIDIELLPLADAVKAGEGALSSLATIVSALASAQSGDLRQKDAKGFAGDAQAAITLFQRAISGLSYADDSTAVFETLVSADDRAPFADAWIRALVSKGDRDARLRAARSTIVERHARVSTQLATIRARYDELAKRRQALAFEREALLDPAPAAQGT